MAGGRVDESHLVKLAEAIPAQTLVKIALEHFDLGDSAIKNIRHDYPEAEAQSREMLRRWLYKNPDNQAQNLARILYKAAKDHGDVDPFKVQEILGISRDDVTDTGPAPVPQAAHETEASVPDSAIEHHEKRERIEVGEVLFEGPVRDETETYVNVQTLEGICCAKLNINSVDSAIVESLIQEHECILSHLLEFELQDMLKSQQGWLAVKAPLPNIGSVKGDKLKIWKLAEDEEPKIAVSLYQDALQDPLPKIMYYRQTEENLTIFTDEPCQFLVTADRCRDVELLVFAELEDSKIRGEREVNMFYYLCSVYDGNIAKQIILSKEKELKRDLVKKRVINLSDEHDDLRHCYLKLDWHPEEAVLYSEQNNKKILELKEELEFKDQHMCDSSWSGMPHSVRFKASKEKADYGIMLVVTVESNFKETMKIDIECHNNHYQKENPQELDEGEIEWVAKHFDHNFDDIAMAYLGLSFVVVKNIKKRIQDRKAQKLEMIKRWMQKNPHNRLEEMANILHKACKEDPTKYPTNRQIHERLKVKEVFTRTPTDSLSFENEIKSLDYSELFRFGEQTCKFSHKVVKEILDEKKGSIEEAANVIITAMYDEYLNKEEAYQRLPSILWEIKHRLTDQMTLALSQRINGENLHILATNGLGVRDYVTDRYLHNERHDIVGAAYRVILDWKRSQENDQVAYRNLCEALKRVGMNMLIPEVLE